MDADTQFDNGTSMVPDGVYDYLKQENWQRFGGEYSSKLFQAYPSITADQHLEYKNPADSFNGIAMICVKGKVVDSKFQDVILIEAGTVYFNNVAQIRGDDEGCRDKASQVMHYLVDAAKLVK